MNRPPVHGLTRGTLSHYGDSHALLNKWFKRTGKRNEIFLATKAGFLMENGRYTINSSGKYLKEAFYKSIAALGIDHVDLCKWPRSNAPEVYLAYGLV